MDRFTTLTAVAAPYEPANVDTDQILPARFLKMPRGNGKHYGGFLFHDIRFADDGAENPGFVLNRPEYRAARILVGNTNFACGSSRENAVTVMVDHGFRAFIAPSFGDIFFGNCFQNGVLPIRLPADRVARIRAILHELPGAEISIDLAAQSVLGPDGLSDRFEIDPFRKDCLLRGVDEINLTLGYEKDIAAFEARQRRELSWL